MQTTRHNSKRARRGMTLIELLVVVFIILAVSAAIVPVIAPTAAGRRQREAARAVSTFLSSARANAIEAGRPAGVWLEGIDGERGTVLTLSHCEVPPAFAGLTKDARVVVQISGGVSQIINMTPAYPVGMIRLGDIISLKHGAAVFQITNGTLDSSFPDDRILAAPDATNPWTLTSVLTTAPATIPATPTGGPGYPFQIFRQPRKSAASAVDLPPGTAIDLYFSGDDIVSLMPRDGERFYSGPAGALTDESTGVIGGHAEPVIILFGSNGIPDSVFRLTVPDPSLMTDYGHLVWSGTAFTRPLYLLVGKSEKVGLSADPTLPAEDDLSSNLVDLDNYWVSINPLTGSISTDPVGAVAAGGTVWNRVQQSRQFAVEKLGIGGR